MHHLALAIVNDRRADEAARARPFAVTPQRLARAVAQHAELPALERLGGWRGLARELRVDLSRGLDGDDLAPRREWFQPDDHAEAKKKKHKTEKTSDAALARRSRWRVARGVLCQDTPTVAMWVASAGAFASVAMNAVLGADSNDDVAEGACLLLLAALTASVRGATEWQRRNQVRELLASERVDQFEEQDIDEKPGVEVLRCDEPTRIARDELCVGDVLLLHARDVAVADGVLVPSAMACGVRVSETAVTGSPWTAFKAPGDVVFAGTRVVAGEARLLVLCVGEFTMARQLARLADPVKRTEAENCQSFYNDVYGLRSTSGSVMDAPSASEQTEFQAGYVEIPGTPMAQRGWVMPGKEEKMTGKEQESAWKRVRLTRSRRRLKKGEQSQFHAQVLHVQRVLMVAGWLAALVLLVVMAAIHVRTSDVDEPSRQGTVITNGSDSFHSMAEEMRRSQQQYQRNQEAWANIFVMAMGVVIVTSTEGAVLVITVAMSAAVRCLKAHRVMFRDIIAAESPGSMTVLCVEKNGTLTTGDATVVQVVVPASAQESGFVDITRPSLDVHHLTTIHQLARWIVLAARHDADDAADRALLQFVRDRGGDVDQIRCGELGKLTRELPICDAHHWTSVALVEKEELVQVVAMGDAEKLLGRCAMFRSVNGVVVPLDGAQRVSLNRQMARQQEAGCRLVGIAYREMAGRGISRAQLDDTEVAGSLDDDMTLFAWIALEEAVRPDAVLAIKQVQEAGVDICVVTCDRLAPARRVARQCGILTDAFSPSDDAEGNDTAMDAAVFREQVVDIHGDVKHEVLERSRPRVLSQASPADKFLFVRSLQASGQRVGTLGSGDGDVLAQCASDVSFAIGQKPNRTWYDASKIVLLDDKLDSMATTIAWGRVVKARLIEFTQLQISTVVVAVVLLITGSIIQRVAPLTLEQLLWVHMLLVFFILLSRWSSRSVLRRQDLGVVMLPRRGSPPRLLESPAITRVVGQVVYQLTVLLLLLKFGSEILPTQNESSVIEQPRKLQGSDGLLDSHPAVVISPSKAVVPSALNGLGHGAKAAQTSVTRTLVFNTFVWMHLFAQVAFHASMCLPQDNTSRRFYAGSAVLAALQVLVVQVLGEWTNCEPLSVTEWVVCVALGSGILVVDYLLRFIYRKLQLSKRAS